MRWRPPGVVGVCLVLSCKAQIPSGVMLCEESNDCPTGFACLPDATEDASFCINHGPELRATQGGTLGVSGCGFESLDPCVDSCIENSCCEEGAACSENAECSALFQCMHACPSDSPDCINDCFDVHPRGLGYLGEYLTCVDGCGCPKAADPCEEPALEVPVGSCYEACLTAECCEEATRCADSSGCSNLFQCFIACGPSESCAAGCASQFASGATEFLPLGTCILQCDCVQSPSGSAPGSECPFTSTSSCQNACLQGTCCNVAQACHASSACSSLFSCIKACPLADTACVTTCQADFPAGIAPLGDLLQCTNTCCPSES